MSVLIGLASLLLLGAVTAPAADAASCVHSSCTGKNPDTYGCGDDATTIATGIAGDGGKVQLRHSSKCDAVWARGYPPQNFGPAALSTDRLDDNGTTSYQSATGQNPPSASFYTHMFFYNSKNQYRACMGPSIRSSAVGSVCTSWMRGNN